MSRSVVVAVIAWVVLMVALIVVDATCWPLLSTRPRVEIALALGLGLYGAGFAATSIRRIVDPKLGIPILAWVLLIAFWVMSLLGRANRRREDPHHYDHRDDDDATLPDRAHMGRGWAIFATIFALGMYAGGIALTWYFAAARGTGTGTGAVAKPALVAEASSAAPAAPSAPPTPTEIVDVPDLAAAIEFARPSLTDSRHAPSEGARLLARYAAAKLEWSAIVVAKNETSLELAEKDPPKATGKRLCATGTLARIEKQTVDGTELHSARLVTRAGDAIELFAVGPTGNLVKRKQARFCGVVTGRLDVEGKPATFAVGMLEIPKRQ